MEEHNYIDLQTYLTIAREKKGYSQRKLAKKIGISNTALSDIEKGKVQKVNIDILRKISEELDLNLEELLKISGHNNIALIFEKNTRHTKSSKSLKNKIEKYKYSQIELLDDINKKRTIVRDNRTRIIQLIEKLKRYDFYKTVWTTEKILEELEDISEELKPACEKYDYSKLPNDN